MTQPHNPGTYGPPQPQPEKKNWFARHKILTGIAALIVVILAVNLASGGGESPTESATPPVAQNGNVATEPTTSNPGIGTAVRDGKFEFTVQNVERGVESVGEQYVTQTPQGEYVLVTMSVANIGDKQQLFDTNSQKLLDAQSREYSIDTVATVTNDPNIGFVEINPGNSVVATLVFDVPVGTEPAKIELHDSLFSGGTTVALG
ncbi:MAG: DUF4352 domain-containing protein [Rhodococcus sp. (in: high G+C Gram-positive bacteria)]